MVYLTADETATDIERALARQLAELLGAEGIQVEVVQVNPPYWPAWVGHVRGIRALCRLLPYLVRLWRALGRVDLAHVMANSGWAWHLFAAPDPALRLLRNQGLALLDRLGPLKKALAARALGS